MGSDTALPLNQTNSKLIPPKMAGNRERSFIMIKPDGVHRGLVGEIIKRFEAKGFKLVAMKFMQASREHLEEDYAVQVGRNICHGSDSVESANHEIKLWFKDEEITKSAPVSSNWIYEDFAPTVENLKI